jgi:hypothetical protein
LGIYTIVIGYDLRALFGGLLHHHGIGMKKDSYDRYVTASFLCETQRLITTTAKTPDMYIEGKARPSAEAASIRFT